jgi:Fic family protein
MDKFNNILKRIDSQKAKLDALRPFDLGLQQKVEQTFRLWWNYHSNAIEGNKLTLGETKSLILHGLTAKGKSLKDHLDIQGHNSVLLLLDDLISDENRDLTENLIRELHELLLIEPYFVDSTSPDGRPTRKKILLGQYKSTPNNVLTSTGEIHHYTSPELVSAEMTALIDWYRTETTNKLHPLLLAAEFHYRFVVIHPFDDGNGRLARILMNMILMKFGYVPAILKIEDRSEYITALENANEDSRIPFYEYIANSELYSIEKYYKGITGEEIRDSDYYFKEIELIERKINQLSEPVSPYDDLTLYQFKANVIFKIIQNIALIIPKISALFEKSHFHVVNCNEFMGENDAQLTEFDQADALANGLTPQIIRQYKYVRFFFRFKGIKGVEKVKQDIASILTFQFENGEVSYTLALLPETEDFHYFTDFEESVSEEEIAKVSNEVIEHLISELNKLMD